MQLLERILLVLRLYNKYMESLSKSIFVWNRRDERLVKGKCNICALSEFAYFCLGATQLLHP